MKEQIRSFLLEAGADVCGFGNVERFLEAPEGFTPTDLWRECKSVISIGVALPKGLSDVPSRLIYAHYNENTCRMVDDLAFYGAKEICCTGMRSRKNRKKRITVKCGIRKYADARCHPDQS